MTIGKTLSQLVRRGMAAPRKTRTVNGLAIIELPGDAGQVTSEDIKKLKGVRLGRGGQRAPFERIYIISVIGHYIYCTYSILESAHCSNRSGRSAKSIAMAFGAAVQP